MSGSGSIVCTLSDATFEPGCAALINSLYANGFRGKVVVGLVGSGHKLPSSIRSAPLDGINVEFLNLPHRSNVNALKPLMLSHCMHQLSAQATFFFDSDIICCGSWAEFEHWADNGIAVCSDVNFLWMPENHPQRAYYRRALDELDLPCRNIVGHANGGFLGVSRQYAEIIKVWGQLLEWLDDTALGRWDDWSLNAGFAKYDQDALNAALMAVDAPVSFVGHEGMSFNRSVGYMVHPVGPRKPWNKGFLWDLIRHGRPLPLAARQFWKHVGGPIEVKTQRERLLASLEMDATAALSRVISR